MKGNLKFALWVGVLFDGVVIAIAAVALLVASGLPPDEQDVLRRILEQRAPLLGYAALILLFACGGIVSWLFRNHVTAVSALAEQTRTALVANPERRIVADGGPELAELAAAIDRLREAYRSQRLDLDAKIAESGSRLEEERNRLSALMSELSQGVLLCNAEGRILLYNEQARALFGQAAAAGSQHSLVGLGRSVFGLLDRDQVAHALDKIQYSLDRESQFPITKFLAAAAGDRLLRVQLVPFLSAESRIAGMVLTLEDVTDTVDQEARRRSLLQALATRVRQPAANIRAAAENLVASPEMGGEQRAQFAEIIAAESRGLSATINDALREHANALKAGLSLEDMPVTDLVHAACRRIDTLLGLPTRVEEIDENLWIRVDSYAFAQVLASLASRLRDEYGVREVRFRAAGSGGFVELDLLWMGAIVASDALALWETQQLGAEQSPLSFRDVLERHGGEVWRQSHPQSQTSWFRFLLPLGAPAPVKPRRSVPKGGRPEYYDFDLFKNADAAQGLAERRLTDINYTVFDTETTGLEPSAGDEIISIGAARIVNGRLLKQEVYEQLINPKRSVPMDSVRIHGIKTGDLLDQPTIGEVLPAFHRFCEDTVLVAHNAAFDMRFLELKEAATGVRFSQPVLDTLLLAALVHPSLKDHGLEAVAERLGLRVIGRHTALGDALVTGDIFLKLVPLLAERGILTLGQTLEASRETYYARLRY
ncbi:MAG: PAS domain-containing protein [Betaproteobacteria bacterium]|nr:PAS domain-containing protein [Betaproteobacteria bacterium]